MSIAFVFPGQGSQAVGMGKALADAFPAARAVFAEADDALGDKLTSIMWEGPARNSDADRECAARAADHVGRGVAGAGSGSRRST